MKSLVLLLFCLLPYFSSAQFWQNKANVVAIDGLNIREEPNIISKKIFSVPYLSEVEILEIQNPIIDTLESYIFHGEHSSYTDFVNGSWLRVRYKNYMGYAFSGYLIELSDDYFKSSTINNKFGINFIGSNCVDNVHRNKNIQWKGLYKIGDQFLIKDVKLRYCNDFKEVTAFKTTTENNQGLVFAFGSESGLFKNGEVQGEFHNWSSGKILQDYSTDMHFDYFETVKETEKVLLILKNSGKRQVLNDQIGSWPNILKWKGDLDGDGKDDYIITYGDKVSAIVLYLSSQAENGNLVEAVACYYSGYCC